jgi:hypothetical protein
LDNFPFPTGLKSMVSVQTRRIPTKKALQRLGVQGIDGNHSSPRITWDVSINGHPQYSPNDTLAFRHFELYRLTNSFSKFHITTDDVMQVQCSTTSVLNGHAAIGNSLAVRLQKSQR